MSGQPGIALSSTGLQRPAVATQTEIKSWEQVVSPDSDARRQIVDEIRLPPFFTHFAQSPMTAAAWHRAPVYIAITAKPPLGAKNTTQQRVAVK